MLKNARKITPVFSTYYLLWALCITNVLLIGLAIILYNGNFLLWQYPFSFAGTVNTVAGLPNAVSSHIYQLDMAISGLIMFAAAKSFSNENESYFKVLLGTLCGIGFFIASLSPDDTRHAFHVIGSGLVVASLWILTIANLFKLKTKLSAKRYYLFQSLSQIPLYAYAITYFLNIDPLSAVLQKFALLGVGSSLLYSANWINSYTQSKARAQ